jgi:uncharacterized caspase-like protein
MSKKALFVGINKYPGENELHGCVPDVTEVRDLLVQKHGYSSDEIHFLTDQKATRAGIIGGLRWLADGATENDTRLFYYSGHGTWVHDQNGDEPDGRDECLVPVDYFATEEPLTDDALHAEYKGMISKKVHLLLVSDSCHSGSVIKDPAPGSRPRFVKPKNIEFALAGAARRHAEVKAEAEREALLTKASQELAGQNLSAEAIKERMDELVQKALRTTQRKYRQDTITGSGILLAGCQDDQTSEERPFGNKVHGALTYYLLDALKAGVPTYTALLKALSDKLRDNHFAQVPNLQCTKANRDVKFLRWT